MRPPAPARASRSSVVNPSRSEKTKLISRFSPVSASLLRIREHLVDDGGRDVAPERVANEAFLALLAAARIGAREHDRDEQAERRHQQR